MVRFEVVQVLSNDVQFVNLRRYCVEQQSISSCKEEVDIRLETQLVFSCSSLCIRSELLSAPRCSTSCLMASKCSVSRAWTCCCCCCCCWLEPGGGPDGPAGWRDRCCIVRAINVDNELPKRGKERPEKEVKQTGCTSHFTDAPRTPGIACVRQVAA